MEVKDQYHRPLYQLGRTFRASWVRGWMDLKPVWTFFWEAKIIFQESNQRPSSLELCDYSDLQHNQVDQVTEDFLTPGNKLRPESYHFLKRCALTRNRKLPNFGGPTITLKMDSAGFAATPSKLYQAIRRHISVTGVRTSNILQNPSY